MKTHKAELETQAERLMKLSFLVDPDHKTELVSIAVALEMTGDRIEKENIASGDALQKISEILKGVLP